MKTKEIEWVRPSLETNVYYGYVEGEKLFYVFHDFDRPAIFGQWVLKQTDNGAETMHVRLENAQGAAAKMMGDRK